MNIREELSKTLNNDMFVTQEVEEQTLKLFKQWALEMVGEDHVGGGAEGFGDRQARSEIRQRIEESTK